MKDSNSAVSVGLPGKLARYTTAAAGGVAGTLAGFESSEAALVVTDTMAGITDSTGSTPQMAIDLDGDTIPEVLVSIPIGSILTAQGVNGAELAGAAGAGGFFYPTGFQLGDTVDGGAIFSGGTVSPVSTYGTLAAEPFGTSAGVGDWVGGGELFLGVKFDGPGAGDNYGWVHIEWDPFAGGGDSVASVAQYAYSDTPGEAAAVPEPSSLALLGLGAMGLAARRLRRSAD